MISKAFVVKFIVYTVIAALICLDLFIIEGPLHKRLESKVKTNHNQMVEVMRDNKIAAYVYMSPITLSQVDYRVVENANTSGIKLKDHSLKKIKTLRQNALNELIEEAIFRVKTEANEDDFNVAEETIQTSLTSLKKRFSPKQQSSQIYGYTGIQGEKEMRLRIKASMEQELYLNSFIKPKITTKESDITQFYRDNQSQFEIPAQAKSRHIFISKQDNPIDGATLSEQLLKRLKSGETFEDLAPKYSKDYHSCNIGGNLGWLKKSRSPDELQDYLFAQQNFQPVIVQTKLGWHIIQKTEFKKAQLQSYEKVEQDIKEAMITNAKHHTIKTMRNHLRRLEGSNFRHTDPTKDFKTIEGKSSTTQQFPELLEQPFSYLLN